MSIAGVLHYRSDIREIEVDEAGNFYKLGDALDTVEQNLIRHLECLDKSHLLTVVHRLELFVGYDNKAVHILGKVFYTLLSLKLLLSALKLERTGDNTDGEYAHILGDSCNYGSGACARSSAHSGSDEYHIRALERVGDNIAALFSRFLAYFRSAACALTLCQLFADLDLVRCAGMSKYLLVRIDSNKLCAEHAAVDHAVDGISAAAADAYNFYLRGYLAVIVEFKRHFVTPKLIYKKRLVFR